jgi:GT2 family glycosyltransferase
MGFAAANNRAFELCRECEYVALLNPDAFPEPGWLEALARAAAETPRAASFASCMLKADDPQVLDGTGDAYHVSGLVWRIGHGEPRRESARKEVFAACAAAALYRLSDVQSVGGFDEAYFCYNEDVDLGFRLRLKGRPCLYVPDAVVRHVGSAVTGRHSDFSLFHGHRNLVWTFFKNMPTGLLLRFVWQHLLMTVVSLVVLSIRYRTLSVVRAKWAAVLGMGRVLELRKSVQAGRHCTNAELRAAMVPGWWRCYVRRRAAG